MAAKDDALLASALFYLLYEKQHPVIRRDKFLNGNFEDIQSLTKEADQL